MLWIDFKETLDILFVNYLWTVSSFSEISILKDFRKKNVYESVYIAVYIIFIFVFMAKALCSLVLFRTSISFIDN